MIPQIIDGDARIPYDVVSPSAPRPNSISDTYMHSANRDRNLSQNRSNFQVLTQRNINSAYSRPSYSSIRPQRTISHPEYNINDVSQQSNAHDQADLALIPSGSQDTKASKIEAQNYINTAYYLPSHGHNRPEQAAPLPLNNASNVGPRSVKQLPKLKTALQASSARKAKIGAPQVNDNTGTEMRPQFLNTHHQSSYGGNKLERTTVPPRQNNDADNNNSTPTTTRARISLSTILTPPPSRDGPIDLDDIATQSEVKERLPAGQIRVLQREWMTFPNSREVDIERQNEIREARQKSKVRRDQLLADHLRSTATIAAHVSSISNSTSYWTPTPVQMSVSPLTRAQSSSKTPIFPPDRISVRGCTQAPAPNLAIASAPPKRLRRFKSFLSGVLAKIWVKDYPADNCDESIS